MSPEDALTDWHMETKCLSHQLLTPDEGPGDEDTHSPTTRSQLTREPVHDLLVCLNLKGHLWAWKPYARSLQASARAVPFVGDTPSLLLSCQAPAYAQAPLMWHFSRRPGWTPGFLAPVSADTTDSPTFFPLGSHGRKCTFTVTR